MMVPAHQAVLFLLKGKISLSLFIYLLRSRSPWLPSTIVNVSYNQKVIFFFQPQSHKWLHFLILD